jgi:hypothetical protein
MRVTFGLVNFGSPIVQRLEREILPTIAHYPEGNFEILCVDNDPVPNRALLDFLSHVAMPVRYLWNGGANVRVATAKNQLYANASHPIVVYVCANHGRMYDPTWLEDLIRPLEDRRVALAGTVGKYWLADIGEGAGTGLFVQGGLLAAQADALRKHPLSERFPHAHSDKWICRELLKNGYEIANVETVKSVWNRAISGPHTFKYVHDDG